MTCRGSFPLTARDVLLHPNYLEFRLRHIEEMLRVLVDSRATTRLMIDGRHQVTARLIVGLDAASSPSDPTSWATMSKLQKIVSECRLASPRLVTEVVARLRARRLIATRPSPLDGRARILMPDDFLVSHDREFLAALIGRLGLIYAHEQYELLDRRDPGFHAVFRAAWAYRARRTVEPFWHNAVMRFLYSRSAGMPALFVALKEQTLHGRCNLTFAEIGGMLGVSRTQVRNIFIDDAAEGLFEISKRGGGITLLPPMIDAFDKMLSENAVAYNSILEDIRSGRPARDPADRPAFRHLPAMDL